MGHRPAGVDPRAINVTGMTRWTAAPGVVWVTDPQASESSPDGFGEENAVLDVREITHHEGKSLEDGIIVQ